MKKQFLIAAIALCIVAPRSNAQTTKTIRPHFNGIESDVGLLDSLVCSGYHSNPYANLNIYPDSNHVIIGPMAWTGYGCKMYHRVLFRFADLTNHTVIPAGSTIISAKLRLYGTPSSPTGDYGNSTYPSSPYNIYGADSSYIYELAAGFNPDTTTWDNQPALLLTDSVLIPPSSAQFGENDTLDVTSMVNHLFTSGNYGFELRMATETIYRMRMFASSRYTDSTLHPALVVTYNAPSAVLTKNNSPAYISVYPNPVSTQVSARITLDEPANMTLKVYNVVGQQLYSKEFSLLKGTNTLSVPATNLTNGVYLLEASNETTSFKQRFVKQQ